MCEVVPLFFALEPKFGPSGRGIESCWRLNIATTKSARSVETDRTLLTSSLGMGIGGRLVYCQVGRLVPRCTGFHAE